MKLDNIIEWRPVYLDGTKSNYEISSNGLLRKADTQELIKITYSGNSGYTLMHLHMNGKKYHTSIHRLVAFAFVQNPDPVNRTQVDHKDGNKLNNCASNLEWVTPKENKRRAIEMGLCNPRHGHQKRGSESGVAVHTEEEAIEVSKRLAKGESYKEIIDATGIDREFIRCIKRGRAWNHITKDFNIPKPVDHRYPPDLKDEIMTLLDVTDDCTEIARLLHMYNPNGYAKRYVAKIKQECLRD